MKGKVPPKPERGDLSRSEFHAAPHHDPKSGWKGKMVPTKSAHQRQVDAAKLEAEARGDKLSPAAKAIGRSGRKAPVATG